MNDLQLQYFTNLIQAGLSHSKHKIAAFYSSL
jgi:hypothetical protein